MHSDYGVCMDAHSTPRNPVDGNSTPGREQRLFTIPQAADVLSLGKSTVWQLVHSGRIESVKIGTARRIRREALDAYVNSLQGAT